MIKDLPSYYKMIPRILAFYPFIPSIQQPIYVGKDSLLYVLSEKWVCLIRWTYDQYFWYQTYIARVIEQQDVTCAHVDQWLKQFDWVESHGWSKSRTHVFYFNSTWRSIGDLKDLIQTYLEWAYSEMQCAIAPPIKKIKY